MPNRAELTNIAGLVVPKCAAVSQNSNAPSLVTAAGTGDATKVTGYKVDRQQGGVLANSVQLVIAFLAALADTKSISFAAEYQDSADGTNWNTAVAMQSSTIAATSSGGTNENGAVELALDLTTLSRYVRFNITPDLSASGTDTAAWAAVANLSGFQRGVQ